jgi:iron complex outermembrane receptor protein
MKLYSRRLAYGLTTAVSVILATSAAAPVRAAEATASVAALEEVIVSARRRDETIQTTPVAVSAVSVAALEAKAAVNLGDLQGSVPNLLITNQNSGAAAANLSMRGLTFADIEKSFDPTVAVVVDGVFLGTSTGQYLDFFDMASIEVLRGPQGTLFGRNTIGGVINITRTKPTGEFGGKIDVSYGRFGTFSGRGVFNMPITDSLAAKFFYFDSRTDGWYRDGIDGRSVGYNHNQNFGASFLLSPQGSDFEALLTIEKMKQKFDTPVSNLVNSSEAFAGLELPSQLNRNTSSDLYTVFGTPAGGHYDAPATTLQLNFSVGSVKFTSVTGYRSSKEEQTQDFDGASEALQPFVYAFGLAPLYYADRAQTFHQFSQELRAAGKLTDSLDYVVGAYYYDSAYKLTQYSNILGSGYGRPQVVSGTAKSLAGFVDFDWAFATNWRLNFGGRYTQDKKSLLNYYPDFLGHPHATFSKFTPKVGIDFRQTPNLMYYASFSRGERSGGFSNRAATAFSTNTAFQPETVDSTEIGVKSEWFDERLSLNVSAFNAKYKNMQQNTTIPGGATGNQTIVSNVGSAVIRGVEIEVTARPTEELTLSGSLGTLNSHFDGFITGAPAPLFNTDGTPVMTVDGTGNPVQATGLVNFDYSANNLIYNPKSTVTLAADYKVPTSFGDVHGHLGYRHIASYDQQISIGPTTRSADFQTIIVHGNDPRVQADAHNLVDAALTADFNINKQKAYVTLYGRNLTNALGPTHAFTVAGLWSFGTAREPRTYGVTVGYEF